MNVGKWKAAKSMQEYTLSASLGHLPGSPRDESTRRCACGGDLQRLKHPGLVEELARGGRSLPFLSNPRIHPARIGAICALAGDRLRSENK